MIAKLTKQKPLPALPAPSKGSYSLEEAAAVLRLTVFEVEALMRSKRLGSYQLPGWPGLRTTRLDLFEYSMVTGRKLKF
jgi:hypothetical protein